MACSSCWSRLTEQVSSHLTSRFVSWSTLPLLSGRCASCCCCCCFCLRSVGRNNRKRGGTAHRISSCLKPINRINQRCWIGVGVEVSHLRETRDSGPYLFNLDLCVVLLQSIWLLCNSFYNWNSVCTLLCTFHWKNLKFLSQVILKYKISILHNKS